MDALMIRKGECDPSIVLRECQRCPSWAQWVAEGAFIPYDIAFSMRI